MRRRITDVWPTAKWLWVYAWTLVFITTLVLWVSEADAQTYGRDTYYGPYQGWDSDMLEEQRRQTELMEQQERRLERERRIQNYEDQKRRTREYFQGPFRWTSAP